MKRSGNRTFPENPQQQQQKWRNARESHVWTDSEATSEHHTASPELNEPIQPGLAWPGSAEISTCIPHLSLLWRHLKTARWSWIGYKTVAVKRWTDRFKRLCASVSGDIRYWPVGKELHMFSKSPHLLIYHLIAVFENSQPILYYCRFSIYSISES